MNKKQVRKIMKWESQDISIDELIESNESAESFAELVDQAWMLLANGSRIYKEKEESVMKAEMTFSELNLSDEESAIVTDYSLAEDQLNVTITELAYLAGFHDCIKALQPSVTVRKKNL